MAAAVTVAAGLALALADAGQMGLGDVVLAGWVALSLGWFGWPSAWAGLFMGFAVQAVLFGLVALRRAHDRPRALPMGPALMAGWLVAILTCPP
jgi:leader peptidase (prepilin peptidase)/N-methyltransferase